ncbi:WD40-repeat-containing domain protein [Zopfochytrium polystomum]|nr:WD40-repeat-containing domain protein [Zopfochytrium polystomum]
MSDPLGVKTQRLQLNYPLGVISGSPDGKLAVVGGRDVLKVVSITKDQVKETINLRSGSKINLNGLTDAKWGTAPCPQSIASAHQDGTIVLWDLDRGVNKQSYTINEHERGAINRICFHPTEEMFVSASHDGSLKVWDPRTKAGQRSTYQPKAGPARDVQFNPTGSNEFIAAFEHGDVQVWDLRVSTEPRQRWGTHSLVLTVDWHPDGRLFASAGRDKLIKVWDSRSDSRKHQAQIQTMSQISRIAWRPALYGGTTTQQIASCSLSGDPRVLVWDLSRPFIPECAVEEHLGDVTDFLWTTSYNIWSVSKDQTVISQDVGVVGYRPVKLLNPAVAKWSVFGEVTFSVPDRQEDRDSRFGEEEGNFVLICFVNKQFTGLFDPQLFDYVSFMRLAWLYHLTPSTASDVCEQNELVAASEQSSDNSQAWATLQLIFESDDDGDEDFDDDDESSLSLDAPSAYANSRRSLFKFLSFDRSADRRPDGRSIVLHDLIDPTGQPVPVVHSPTPMTPAPRDMVSADFLVPTLDGEDMFRTILEYFAEQGNVQMCATIVLALRDYIDVPIETQEQWVWNYVDLLRRMQLWIPATAVLKESAHLPLTGTRNQNSTTIHTMCSTCGKAISAAPAAGWCCERCHTTVKCSLCRKTVFGQFTWCHGCSHGGHLTCLQEWFSENSQCSAGCGHACTL